MPTANPELPKSIFTRMSDRLGLFGQFVIISLAVFTVMGYSTISIVNPAIRSYITAQQERDAVVFVNRQANRQLSENDFRWPSTVQSQERLRLFANDIQVPARFRVKIYNRDHVVVYSDAPEIVGQRFSDATDVAKVIGERRSVTEFKTKQETALLAENKTERDVNEFFEIYIPVTFGADPNVVGVINTYSRTAFVNKSADEVARTIGTRIIFALAILYVALSGIVWRASRTILRQHQELRKYATELEDRVHERTRQIEAVTKKQLAQAAELARLKDEFVFIAAHELRTPVTGINWNLDLAFRDPALNQLSEKGRGYLQDVRIMSKRLASLVNDLLSVSRIEAGTLQVNVAPLALDGFVQSVCAMVGAVAEEKKVALVCDAEAMARLPNVLADETRLQEVFVNLLANAIKFNIEGGTVEVTAEPRDRFVDVHVRDTGIGIAPENHAKLFTKFWRAQHDIPGTGLGLWIMKQIIDKMHGTISFISKLGGGTTFTVSLPIATDGGKMAAAPNKTS